VEAVVRGRTREHRCTGLTSAALELAGLTRTIVSIV
jgi:hypothetical protein